MPPTSRPSVADIRPRFLVLAVALIACVISLGMSVGWKPVTEADGEVLEEMVEHRNGDATTLMRLVTDVFSPGGTLLIGLIIAALFAWRRSIVSAVFVLGSTAAASAITLAMKYSFARQRPPVIDHLTAESDYGFPSGHVTGTTALLVATTIAVTAGWSARNRWLAAIVPLGVIAIVAASRLYLGVHWFSDTAAGFGVGLAGVALGLAVVPPESLLGKPRRAPIGIRQPGSGYEPQAGGALQ